MGAWKNADDYRREAETGFDAGFQLGASVEHREAVAAVANALLAVLGKDAADGSINLGAAGRWAWESRRNRWERHDEAYSYREGRWPSMSRIVGATE